MRRNAEIQKYIWEAGGGERVIKLRMTMNIKFMKLKVKWNNEGRLVDQKAGKIGDVDIFR